MLSMEQDYEQKSKTTWAQSNNNDKARLSPKRLLHELLILNKTLDTEIVVVEVKDWGEGIEKAAKRSEHLL